MKKAYARAIPAPWRRIARIFVALGDPHRQRILLMFERGERLNVGPLARPARDQPFRGVWAPRDWDAFAADVGPHYGWTPS